MRDALRAVSATVRGRGEVRVESSKVRSPFEDIANVPELSDML